MSGLSVRAFCARHGLACASFYAWRRGLERRAAELPAFVPVQVVADATPAGQASALASISTGPSRPNENPLAGQEKRMCRSLPPNQGMSVG